MDKMLRSAIRPAVVLAAYIKNDDMSSHSVQRFSRALIIQVINIVVSLLSLRILNLRRMGNIVRMINSLTIFLGAAALVFSPVNVELTVGNFRHILDTYELQSDYKIPSLLPRLVCFIVVMIFFTYRSAAANGINGPLTVLISMHPNFVLASIQYQFLALVRLTSSILSKLTNDLKKSNNDLSQVLFLLKLYRTLVKATESLNIAFSSANLFITIISIVVMSSTLYFLISDSIKFLIEEDMSLILDILVTFLYFSFFLVQLLEVVSVCASTEEKALLFCDECHNIVMQDTTQNIQNSAKIWIHNLFKPVIKFHAGEYINLDFLLVRQIIGNAITFAVLLLQFVKPEGKPHCHVIYTNSSIDSNLN